MMLKPCNVRCKVSAGSKKHALDLPSDALADAVAGPSAAAFLKLTEPVDFASADTPH